MRSVSRSCFLCALAAGAFSAASVAAAMTPADLSSRLSRRDPVLIIDVRTANAYADGHIPGAINIPVSLLPHKPLPTGALVVVCGDGLGAVDDNAALQALRERPGLSAEVLEGGYAAWLAETRLTTAAAGVSPERFPGITYDQLVATAKADVVLIDVRGQASVTVRGLKSAAAAEPDLVDGFARKLGVPVVRSNPADQRGRHAVTLGDGSAASRRVAAQSLLQPGKLMVLVADDEAQVSQLARDLRTLGHYRFTVLIGGTEAIRHEGRIGLGRLTGNATPLVAQP